MRFPRYAVLCGLIFGTLGVMGTAAHARRLADTSPSPPSVIEIASAEDDALIRGIRIEGDKIISITIEGTLEEGCMDGFSHAGWFTHEGYFRGKVSGGEIVVVECVRGKATQLYTEGNVPAEGHLPSGGLFDGGWDWNDSKARQWRVQHADERVSKTGSGIQ